MITGNSKERGPTETKLENPGEGGDPNQLTTNGGGTDIFWNHTIPGLVLFFFSILFF